MFTVILVGCNKHPDPTPLTGQNAIFIGNWTWIKTTHKYGWCDGLSYESEMSPASEEVDYSFSISEKADIQFFEDENMLSEHKVFVNSLEGDCVSYGGTIFYIYLDDDMDDPTMSLNGCVTDSSITVIRGFPYSSFNEECERFISHFRKE